MRERLKTVQTLLARAVINPFVPGDVRGLLGELLNLLTEMAGEIEALKEKTNG
jgi:hypothetical protein